MYTPNPELYYKTTPDFTYNAQQRDATDNWIYASPVVDSNGTIYVCTNKGMVHADLRFNSLDERTRTALAEAVASRAEVCRVVM